MTLTLLDFLKPPWLPTAKVACVTAFAFLCGLRAFGDTDVGGATRDRDVAATVAPAIRVERGIEYARRGATSVTLDWTRPAVPNGAAVLFVASDGWVSHTYDPTPWMNNRQTAAGQLVDAGFAFAVVRHRSGGDARVPDAMEDVLAAVDFVRRQGDRFAIDVDRIGVFGKSSGGHLALLTGTVSTADQQAGPRVKTVVAWGAPTDLRPLFWIADRKLATAFPALDFRPDLAKSVSPLAHVSADDASILMIHGGSDQLVPIIGSRVMQATVEQVGGVSKLVTIDGGGHMFGGVHYDQAVAETVAWFREQLAE